MSQSFIHPLLLLVQFQLLWVLRYQKKKNDGQRVWCFIGDMTYETGIFWEAYKYSVNFNLPLTFVIEDNGKSVTSIRNRLGVEKCICYKMLSTINMSHHILTMEQELGLIFK